MDTNNIKNIEDTLAYPNKDVFKLQFSYGEFDMVVFDPAQLNCDIYEVKHSLQCIPDQYRFLINEELSQKTAFRYGPIQHKYVLYRGATKTLDNGIIYLNVEDYLNALK